MVEVSGEVATTLNSTGATSTQGQPYKLRLVANGTNVKVFRQPAGGGIETEHLSVTTGISTTTMVKFTGAVNGSYAVDDVKILASNLSRSTTFTPANNNELSSSSDYNGSTTYSYDAWGRLSTEVRNSVTKTYNWTAANQLNSVSSTDAADIDVAYLYTPHDLKRIWRLENGALKNTYHHDAGFNVIAEGGWTSLTQTSEKTFVSGLAEVDTFSTPSYSYMTRDHLGSTRGSWNDSKVATGAWEFGPYGTSYLFAAAAGVTQLYTGHDLERATGHYFAPFRTLNPGTGKWLSPDPLGMIDGTNMYGYAYNSPTNWVDPLGLFNAAKGLVAVLNALNAGRLIASGMIKLGFGASATATGVGAPVGVFAVASAGWNFLSASGAYNRSVQQWNEALNEDWDDASWRNLLGVGPWGTEYDDPCETGKPCEPTIWEVLKEKFKGFKDKPIDFLREIGTFGF